MSAPIEPDRTREPTRSPAAAEAGPAREAALRFAAELGRLVGRQLAEAEDPGDAAAPPRRESRPRS